MQKERLNFSESGSLLVFEMDQLRDLIDDANFVHIWDFGETNIIDFCKKAKFQDKIIVEAMFINSLGYEGGKKIKFLKEPLPKYRTDISVSEPVVLPLSLEFLYKTDHGCNDGVDHYVFVAKNMRGLLDGSKTILNVWDYNNKKTEAYIKTMFYFPDSRSEWQKYVYEGIIPSNLEV